MDNPIFIVGLPRSGSTLWANMITMNRKVMKIEEIFFMAPPWRKDFRYFLRTSVGDLSQDENIRKMVNLLYAGKRIPGITASFWIYRTKSLDNQGLKENIINRLIKSDRSLQAIFKAIIEEIPDFYGFNRCCVKFPVFVNYIPYLLQWYPTCKIIHITRDPRAMAVSRVNFKGVKRIETIKKSKMSNINRKLEMLFVSFQYIWTSRLHVKFNQLQNYALFKYEDLLANPEKVIRELCNFVEIDFVPAMLRPKEGQTSSVTGLRSEEFNINAASHWKDVITPFEEKAVTFLTRDSMKRFGFDPENHPVYNLMEKGCK